MTGAQDSEFGGFQQLSAASRRVLEAIENMLDHERDQLPLGLPVAVGMGIAAWQYGGTGFWAPWLCLCAALFVGGMAIGREWRCGSLLRWTGLALAVGFVAITAKSALVATPPLGTIFVGEFHGRVTQVEMLSARDSVRLTMQTGDNPALPDKIRVSLRPEQYRPEFRDGAILRLRARLMPPAMPALPGGYDFARRSWFQSLGATGTALGQPVLVAPAAPSSWLMDVRSRLTRHIVTEMPGGAGSVGAALITGDQGHIAEDDAQAMRDSGLAHLLSVSGLHVTAVVGFIFLLVSRTLALWPWLALRIRVPIVAASVAAIGAVGYTLLTGAEVPTIRSCIAALLILVALALGRDPLSLRLVAFGALIVLLFWPETMAGPSFQLSFAAVATIVVLHQGRWLQALLQRRDEPFLWKIGRGAFGLIITGLAIEIVLAPIALYHFHRTGLYGALANVLAIPLTTFFVMPMEALALLFDAAGIGYPFWWLAGQGNAFLLSLAHYISGLPGAVSTLPSMPDWAFTAMLAGALWFGLLRSRLRLLGMLPFFAGMLAMLLAPRPDLMVTGDGRHVALVDIRGEIALLRPRAGEFTRDMMLEHAGLDQEPLAIEDMPGVKCSPDICIFAIERSGRRWNILATRSRYFIDWREMTAACANVDIAISDRWLPKSCSPRWIKADRQMLMQAGGLAFYLSRGRIESVNARIAHTPWLKAAQAAHAEALAARKHHSKDQ